jgi:hypothetical protein
VDKHRQAAVVMGERDVKADVKQKKKRERWERGRERLTKGLSERRQDWCQAEGEKREVRKREIKMQMNEWGTLRLTSSRRRREREVRQRGRKKGMNEGLQDWRLAEEEEREVRQRERKIQMNEWGTSRLISSRKIEKRGEKDGQRKIQMNEWGTSWLTSSRRRREREVRNIGREIYKERNKRGQGWRQAEEEKERWERWAKKDIKEGCCQVCQAEEEEIEV